MTQSQHFWVWMVILGLSFSFAWPFMSTRRPKVEVPDSKHKDSLTNTARLEHELDLLPHNDSDVRAHCSWWECRPENLNRTAASQRVQYDDWSDIHATVLTQNERRKMLASALDAFKAYAEPEVTYHTRRPDGL